ncbi:OprO/OprP family phosphate-selective porin [Sulfurimonas sp. HSL-3221]|uniref:OprO/OprP family phosphate-selective porin n=1 Tax=Sulfurimonadaceae TaxID=2771471 RepID=UPI001E3F2E0C|nr:OprO/OprP family phosphate-selective porin [Sulfurimonas sp. HSL-3221]UFS63287.1 OprO/OprP family phosphate-selective porin [Sulfurimonas sp. HSL-3221]
MLLSAMSLEAANWLMLQGTQPDNVAPKGVVVPYRNKMPVVWGFIQANYKQDYGDVFIDPNGGNKTPFSLLNPNLADQEGFSLFRARLAARGMADNDNKVNYFFMTEFGNNAVNNLAGHDTATYFTDASVTLRHVPGLNARIGMFKTPGSEEGLRAVFVSPYIEFTTMTNQQLLERQVTNVGTAQTGKAAGGASTVHYTSTDVTRPIAAFRDMGIELFDTFALGQGWTLSYAYMYGNGTGISHNASDHQATHYGYLALEDDFGAGKGFYTEALKFFVWGQTGKRRLYSTDANGTTTPVKHDRKRYGIGFSYYENGLRAEAEYMWAEGMIYTGAKDTDPDPYQEEWQLQFAVGTENKAEGGYLNLQYELFPKQFEVFGRYDFMNRLTNDSKGERDFQTITLGCSYRFRGPTRIDFNYMIRDAKAPGNAAAQNVLDNMGDRLAIQLTAAF